MKISRKGAKKIRFLSLRLCAFAGDCQSAGVALETGKFRSLHRAAAITRGIRFGCEFEYLTQLCVDVFSSRRKSRFARRFLETIPRTNILTDVATIQPTR